MSSTSAEPTDAESLVELGQAVRARRTQLGLTLSNVSEGTGLSVPFLSQVETAYAAPSLISLFSIARFLDTTPERLLAGPVTADVVVTRSDEGQRYLVTDDGEASWRRQLTGLGEPFSVAEYEVQPGADLGGYFASVGREMIHVKSGCLAVDLARDNGEVVEHELRSGDSIVYPSSQRHRWRPLGRAVTRFVLVSVSHR
ncbi:MAG: XRE family transcriptional regulator [Actinomycetota bacterium]